MSSNVDGLFGKGGAAQQLFEWQVLGQVLSVALGPVFELLAREVNKALPATPLSPADLADMVVRNIVQMQAATDYARESGVAAADFTRMVQSAGEGLAPGELAEALRRGLIPESGTGPDSISFEQGVAESRTRNKWANTIKALSVVEPTPADALNALLQGQIPYDQAHSLYVRFGGDPDHFTWLFNSRGSAPTPLEAASMARRGIIPWSGNGPGVVSFEQAFLEGPWRDKWLDPYHKLSVYVPPARTVITLVKDGDITDEQALALFQDNGLTPELAQVYLTSAHKQRSSAHKAAISTELRTVARKEYVDGHIPEAQFRSLLAQANVPADAIESEVSAANLTRQFGRHALSVANIRKLWQGGAIDDRQATAMLVESGYVETDAESVLKEWQLGVGTGRSGLSTTRILQYLKAGVLTPDEAYDRLTGNGMKSADARFLVDHPETSGGVKSKSNTESDIVAAYKDGILTQDDTNAKLQALGLTSDAASLKLQIANTQLAKAKKPRQTPKSLSEAHILEAYKLGLATEAWAERELETVGWSVNDAQLLVAIETAKMNSGQAPPGWVTLD